MTLHSIQGGQSSRKPYNWRKLRDPGIGFPVLRVANEGVLLRMKTIITLGTPLERRKDTFCVDVARQLAQETYDDLPATARTTRPLSGEFYHPVVRPMHDGSYSVEACVGRFDLRVQDADDAAEALEKAVFSANQFADLWWDRRWRCRINCQLTYGHFDQIPQKLIDDCARNHIFLHTDHSLIRGDPGRFYRSEI